MSIFKLGQRIVVEKLKWLAGMPYRGYARSFGDMTLDEVLNFQNNRLLQVYDDAIRHTPYYANNKDAYPHRLTDSGHPHMTVAQLPILEKSLVKERNSDFWRDPKPFGTGEHTTGGTTGSPLRVRGSILDRGLTNAILEDRYRRITGTMTPRILRLSGFLDQSDGDDLLYRRIPFTKFAYLSIYALNQENRERIVDLLGDFEPQVIHGYASAISQLSSLFINDELPRSIKPFVVVSTSETLYPEQRSHIEQRLRTTVFNEYGSQEGQHLVIECRARRMHIHPARGIVEILDDDQQPTPVGQYGRVVVTGLANRAMPLLRYDLGDSAVSTGYENGCECGLDWPTIGTVLGRTEDLVRTPDGRRIGLLAHSTLKDIVGVKESQIVQRDYYRFVYKIVLEQGANIRLIENHVRQELRKRLGYESQVEFDYVPSIPRTQAGKLRAVVVEFQDK